MKTYLIAIAMSFKHIKNSTIEYFKTTKTNISGFIFMQGFKHSGILLITINIVHREISKNQKEELNGFSSGKETFKLCRVK